MNARNFAVTSALLLLALIDIPASTTQMPVEEIRPGMEGVGQTVFEGSKLERFQVHILGVLANVTGPKRNLILARLEGGPLAQTGVIAGMSGSPVSVDGRLIGAVSYSLGAFSKEPIAGITPIAEMTEATASPLTRPHTVKAQLELPVTREGLSRVLAQAFSWTRPFADRPGDARLIGGAATGQLSDELGTMLRPIATPLVMAGFSPEMRDTLMGAFQSSGFAPVLGGGTADYVTREMGTGPLRPGDPIGVNLISGDLLLGATGTITHIDSDRIYAFGHPFYNLGPTQFPLTRAYVHAILPSLFASQKIATTGEVIGTMQQDRATAIAGTLGKGPAMIPVNVSLETGRGLKKAFKFQVVNDQLFTPLLTYVSIVNTLSSYEREFGAATFSVKGKVAVKKHGEIGFEDVFTGDQPSIGAATYVVAPIASLLGNDFEPVEIEGLDIAITSTEEPRTAFLERVWVDDVRPKPGKSVPLKMLLRTYRGEELTKTVDIDIPANASGSLSVLVSDGSRMTQFEQREVHQPLRPHGVPQMIRALNHARKNNRLYVKLLTNDAGAVVNGEMLSSLPPSVLAVLEADRNSGNFIPLRNASVGEWELQTDYAVSGSRMLTINIDRE
jgi:hypothetical protein